MNRALRFALAPVLALVVSSTTGCATLQQLVAPLFGGGASAEPAVSGEELSLLYSKGIHAMMPDPIKDLKINPSEKVWVINKTGGTNTDHPIDALTYDAIVDVLRQKGISDVVARDDDMIRSLYVEYTESAKLAARADSLAKEGKIQPADVMLAYRVVRLNTRQPGYIILGVRYFLAGIIGLFVDAQPNNSDGLRMVLHIEAIDVKTGTVRATKIVEHVEGQPDGFAADYVFTDGAKDREVRK
jgi:hypothetical protein